MTDSVFCHSCGRAIAIECISCLLKQVSLEMVKHICDDFYDYDGLFQMPYNAG